MAITDTIRAIREGTGLTQEAMAERLETTRSNYAYLESRGEKLSTEQLTSIAKALGVSLGEILGLENKPTAIDAEQVKRLEKRVRELEDRINDKDFKIKSLAKELFKLKFLIFASLSEGVNASKSKMPEYVKFIKEHPWLIILLSGIMLNDIHLEKENGYWKKYWKKALSKRIDDIQKKIENLEKDEVIFHYEISFSLTSKQTFGPMPTESINIQAASREWEEDPDNEVEHIYWYNSYIPKSESTNEDI